MYKAALTDWHKGTGGGSGLATEFESWDKNHFEKYKIDEEDYDHTKIESRPTILMYLYAKKNQPFIIIIHLWDKLTDCLLSAKYDSLSIGAGEPGMAQPSADSACTSSSTNISTSSSNSSRKRKNLEKTS